MSRVKVLAICIVLSVLACVGFLLLQKREKGAFNESTSAEDTFTEETEEGREIWIIEGGKTYWNDDAVEFFVTESEREYVKGCEAKETTVCTAAPASFVCTVCDTEVPYADYLCTELEAVGIGWWFPYACATVYQESRCDIYAVSKDGYDHGLFQYRAKYWDAACEEAGIGKKDIYDPLAQIDVYVFQTARRLNEYGYDAYSAVSAHKQSDWGKYDAKYVAEVTQWLGEVWYEMCP